MAVLLFIFILVGLIIVHELGHFAVAKAFGIRVEEFGIFFPPRIAGMRMGETLYSINWIPLGGFVRIFGENPQEGAHDPRSFSRQHRLVQVGVVVAGVAMNLLAAWLLLSAGYLAGLPTARDHEGVGAVTNARPMITAVLPGSPGEKSGFVAGDIVEDIQTGTTNFDLRTLNIDQQADQVRSFIAAHAEESMVVTVLRNNTEMTFVTKAADGVTPGRKAVGIELDDVGVLRLPPYLALWQGALLTKNIVVLSAQGLGTFAAQLVEGRPDWNQVAGPIGIVSLGGLAIQQGLASVLVLVSSISIALALVNLVPIPGLDGGRLLIILIEGATRRRVPQRAQLALTILGAGLIVVLVVLISAHDIARLVG
jgi:regulator of sigma E protease